MSEDTRAFRKTRVGTVVSDKMDKTIVVAIEDSVQHASLQEDRLREPTSSRRMTRTTSAASAIPSSVMETRPLSKDKRWRLVEIIEKAK